MRPSGGSATACIIGGLRPIDAYFNIRLRHLRRHWNAPEDRGYEQQTMNRPNLHARNPSNHRPPRHEAAVGQGALGTIFGGALILSALS